MKGSKENEVSEAVKDWIGHVLIDEPSGLTSLREAYLRHHLLRCLLLIDLVPNPRDRGKLLELGSGLYLMTFLLRRLRNYDLDLVQYWGMPKGEYESILVNRITGEPLEFPFMHLNVEEERFPFPDASFDVLLACEIIEHLLCDPVHMLSECHRVLKPEGLIIVSTPNVLRISNLIKLIQGYSVYDKYCAASPYARHSREYTPYEIHRLLEEVGFRVKYIDTKDILPSTYSTISQLICCFLRCLLDLASKMKRSGPYRSGRWRQEHILIVAKKHRPLNSRHPDWLFEAPDLEVPIIEAICRKKKPAS